MNKRKVRSVISTDRTVFISFFFFPYGLGYMIANVMNVIFFTYM